MIQEKLLAAGVNYQVGTKRFCGNTALYEKFLRKFPEDPNYKDMMLALEQKDYEAAFKYAHTLKGVAGNLSLDHLYQQIIPLVEALRNQQLSEIEGMVALVATSYQATVEAIL